MWHQLVIGILLGWGAAIPIGPMNLEIVRRNLRIGTRYGVSFGLGACSADITYLILLSVGAITILQHPLWLRSVGFIGALILAWFGIMALRMPPPSPTSQQSQQPQRSLFKHWGQGYLLTLLNPYTVLFWASVSSQIVSLSRYGPYAAVFTGLGVLIGTVSWVSILNGGLHISRHKIPDRIINYLNKAGGIILLVFAAIGVIHAIY